MIYTVRLNGSEVSSPVTVNDSCICEYLNFTFSGPLTITNLEVLGDGSPVWSTSNFNDMVVYSKNFRLTTTIS